MSEETKIVINCEPYMDISDANNIHKELMSALESNADVDIDASEVERIDTSVLQLFYSFMNEAKLRNVNVRWSKVAEPVEAAANTLGLRGQLGLP